MVDRKPHEDHPSSSNCFLENPPLILVKIVMCGGQILLTQAL